MAFFPANATYPSMLGELYSAAFTAPAFNWICSPAVTELETIVLDWLAKLLNLPSCYLSTGEGGGVIQGSASESVVTVMVAARDKFLRETTSHLSGEELEDAIAHKRSKLVALGSDQAHSSIKKAALITGVRYRSIPTRAKDNFAITGEALKTTLEECKSKGLEPFFVATCLGTTSTCAVDDFSAVASVLHDYAPPGPGEVWVHVDAAYAGAALVCPEFQHLTSAFERLHSFDVNLHKWLLTNFDASCLFIKKRKDLWDALSVTPSYLRNEYTESGLVTDYRDWQIPLGRRFRALKIWFVMRSYGVSGLQTHIRRTLTLGSYFHGLIQSRKDLFSVFSPLSFALTVFTIVPKKGSTKEETDKLTKDVYELVNKRGEIYITSSVVDGTYVIRVVSANPLAEKKFLSKAFDILVRTVEEVRDGRAEIDGHSPGTTQLLEVGKGVGEAEIVQGGAAK